MPDRQASDVHSIDHATRSAGQPPPSQTDALEFPDLDESLVRCSVASKRKIRHPPPGEQGSQGRWYFVTRGKMVGIFNEWCVCFRVEIYPLNDPRRETVQAATSGVSGSHQQRVKTEALAYAFFNQALRRGTVEVIV